MVIHKYVQVCLEVKRLILTMIEQIQRSLKQMLQNNSVYSTCTNSRNYLTVTVETVCCSYINILCYFSIIFIDSLVLNLKLLHEYSAEEV